MQAKKRRQELLRDLIRRETLSTQEELVDRLAKHKIRATQSSISRDLEDLGIVKVQGRYALPSSTSLGLRLLWLKPAGESMLVARCEPGLASAVSVEIDKAHLSEVVGTVAGDDTIFIAVDGRAAQKSALQALRGIFSHGSNG